MLTTEKKQKARVEWEEGLPSTSLGRIWLKNKDGELVQPLIEIVLDYLSSSAETGLTHYRVFVRDMARDIRFPPTVERWDGHVNGLPHRLVRRAGGIWFWAWHTTSAEAFRIDQDLNRRKLVRMAAESKSKKRPLTSPEPNAKRQRMTEVDTDVTMS